MKGIRAVSNVSEIFGARWKSALCGVTIASAILAWGCFFASPGKAVAKDSGVEVWKFDHIDKIGGHKTTVLGHPKVINTPIGKAIEFNGKDDAIFLDVHPLAGAATFTWEAIFRPDGGDREQRWFHLQEANTENRMLFEIRVDGNQWFLDSFNQTGKASKALINRNALHPVGAWYHVAAVYDGHEFRNYVNGVQEGSAEIHLEPQAPGRTAIGVRINKVNYFKGAVHMARFTRHALTTTEFLKVPGR